MVKCSFIIYHKKEKFLLNTYRIIVIALLGFLLPFFATASKVDSLLNILYNHHVNDTVKVRLFIAAAEEYKRTNTYSTLLFANKANALSEKLGFNIGKIKSLQQLGYAYIQLNELDTASFYLNEALKIARQSKDLFSETTTLMAIGNMQYGMGKYDSALLHYNKCLALAKQNKDIRNQGSVLMNMGCIYNDLRKYSDCITYYLRALKILEKGNYPTELANCYSNMASFYVLIADYKKALYLNNLSLNIYEKTGNIRGSLAVLSNEGMVYTKFREYSKSLEVFKKAIQRADSIGDQYWRNICIINSAGAYYNLGQYDTALSLYNEALNSAEKTNNFSDLGFAHFGIGRVFYEKGKYPLAIKELLIAFSILKENNIKDPTYIIANKLSNAYEKTHEKDRALFYKKVYCNYLDTLYEAKSDKNIFQLQYEYELEKKEHKIADLQNLQIMNKAKAERDHLLTISFGVGFFLLLCIVCVLFWNHSNDLKSQNIILKKNEEIEQHIADLESLNQFKNKTFSILSHDLKSPINSLSSAVNMLKDGQIAYEDVKTFIPEMGKKLDSITFLLDNLLLWAKESMNGVSKPSPTNAYLSEVAAQNVELFKDIANNKSLSLNNRIPINLTAFCDPTHLDIIFRNLIANAIKFSNPKGIINITATSRKDKVEIAISDNGVGMSKEQLEKLFIPSENNSTYGTAGEKGTGIGLLLCNDYIKTNNGSIEVTSELRQGTTFTLILPQSTG